MAERLQLHVSMLTLQFGYAGFHIVSRAALNMGISKLVFPIYRNTIALILLVPFAYFREKNDRPAMKLSFLVQFFLLALCGITANQGFYLLGLDNTSPTFASAIQNSVPAITFLMAAALRIERVRLDRRDGVAKVLGTVACVGGASAITLFKGPTIFGPPRLGSGGAENWTLGCLFLIGHCLCWSGWLVLQAPVLKKYPARLSVTSYTCFFGVIQFLAIAAFVEKDLADWSFNSGGEVFTVLYAGIVASGIAFAVQIWCIDRGGPVFVAVYQPVQTLVVAIMASIFLGEEFHLGGVIGAALIVAGLYLVLWGKSQEKALLRSSGDDDIASSSMSIADSMLTQPLLPSPPPKSV